MLEKLGPYILEKQIGRGGMGFVYAAHHEETKDRVAVKMLSAGFADDENFRNRFSLEIETLKQLHHDGIVQIYGFGEQDGTLFYSMELVDGKSLYETLKDDGPVAWRDAVQMTIEICHALKHAHDRGVIHRDLKPSNLILSAEGSVKLVDFGIARLFGTSQLTADHAVVGTADYMSPEQAEGQRPTVRSDLYSLGAVMYALLSGKPPFASPSVAQVILKLRNNPPPSLVDAKLDLPRELDQIIRQLLSKNPDERVPTPLAVIHRLQAMQHALESGSKELPPESRAPVGNSSAQETYSDDSPTGEFTKNRMDQDDSPTLLQPTVQGAYETGEDAEKDESSSTDPMPEEEQATTVEEGPRSHFTRVDPSHAEQANNKNGVVASVLIALGFLVTIGVIFGFTRWMNRPSTAEELLSHIQQARIEPGSDWIQANEEMKDFIQRFPDHDQYEYIKSLHDELAAERNLQKYIDQLSDKTDSLDVVELQLLDILTLAQQDPKQGVVLLEAFITAYESFTADTKSVRCVDYAKTQFPHFKLTATQAEQEQTRRRAKYLAEIDRLIANAATLAKTNRDQAIRMLQNAQILFQQQEFLEDVLPKLNRAIEEIQNPEITER